MNCGAATASLPKFVGFPSLRGLHSSTVQLRRAPLPGRRAPVRRGSRRDPGTGGHPGLRRPPEVPACRTQLPESRLGPSLLGGSCPTGMRSCQNTRSCPIGVRHALRTGTPEPRPARETPAPPVGMGTRGPPQCGPRVRWVRLPRRERGRRTSAASAAAAASSSTPAAGRPAAAGVPPAVSAGRAGVSAPGPPATPACVPRSGGRPRPATGRPPGSAAAGLGHQRPDQDDSDHRQDDADYHGVTLLPFPRSGPPWAPRSCVKR
jgi:hypothetical protein